jgi:hypothetical protein
MINPFFHRGPVRDPAYFFGRQQEVAYIADLLRAGQSIALNGQRRFGKTSLLFQISNPQFSNSLQLGPDTTRWVYLDGGALDGLDEDWFYGTIDRALGGEADAVTYGQFVNRLRDLASQNLRLVLLLDEFELIAANPHFGPALFNHLRGLAAQYPLQFITASRDPLLQLTFANRETMSSPFFNIFAPLLLGLFADSVAADLLITLSSRAGQTFDSETVAGLIRFVGPHPLFLQVAGYRTFADPSGLQDPAGRVRSQIYSDLEQHLTYYWNNLDAEAQYTLAALPLLDSHATLPAVKRLVQAGLLLQTSEVFKISEVLVEFIRRQKIDGLLQSGSFLLDTRQGLAAVDGQTLHLTPTEFAALKLFLERPGQTLSAEEIEAALWPGEQSPDPERARGVIKKLRAALGESADALENRRGQGWTLAI